MAGNKSAGKGPQGFKKGDSRASLAGKKSSRAFPADLKDARMQNAIEFESSIYKYFNYTLAQLEDLAKDPATSSRDLVVIAILINSISEGDHQRLNFLLERTIGKVTDKINVSGKVETYREIRLRMENLSEEDATNRYFEMLKVTS